ncbi:malto-oligosyltrehalose trehalohydrolase [Acrocarpospora macrocephala]|uniref:Malto-oligosyltrehalose trehalohydrolase n=1 Tax=Acrocarpospora macrocephala TaxID=150177 RepID=A0A5M3WL97_9ACTN|nr:malto-oligosyltrehalose trehalohydrolase [Acrocarpospora macrocephala]GES10035.1 malto-oligosyltrehalose trehalohydrolase [Acrocarpospora macrocephala]
MYEVWAPLATRVEVESGSVRRDMSLENGWWRAPGDEHGVDYAFYVDGSGPFPDPRTRRQPYGLEGPSRVYEHARFTWGDQDWRGRHLRGSVIYEMHVGTYTPEGTFEAVIDKLGHLVDLGVDFVELMPVAPVPGRRNWGYDGVDLYAVREDYGGPDGLKILVDACHQAGLGVILDVVYNHLGPCGNYLSKFGPYLHGYKGSYWGDAVNLDGPHSDEVRRYFIENALQWLRDYHIDGLRLDAVHALHDKRAVHFLEELAGEVEALSTVLGRPLTLIAESDLNDPGLITRYGLDATWNDDVHHALHSAVTGETHAYYGDFGSLAAVAKVMTSAYFHDGGYSTFRGRSHGRPATGVSGHRFVCCVQNHDQIGNRPLGDRMSPEQLWLAAGLLLTSPFTPMLFMGEEWGAQTPFYFFTDHYDPVLAAGEGERRRREFESFGYDWKAPDPQDETTFLRSKLDWSEPAEDGAASLLGWYRDLIALRKSHPDLADPRLERVHVRYDDDRHWLVIERGSMRIAANLGHFPVPIRVAPGHVLLASDEGTTLTGSDLHLPPLSMAIVHVVAQPKL